MTLACYTLFFLYFYLIFLKSLKKGTYSGIKCLTDVEKFNAKSAYIFLLEIMSRLIGDIVDIKIVRQFHGIIQVGEAKLLILFI